MNKIRSFLAIDFGAFYSEEIKAIFRNLEKQLTGVKWTNPEEAHLTLSFFGEIDEDLILSAGNAVESLAAKRHAFSLGLRGVGAFPNFSSPKVLWAGLSGQTELLLGLKRDIDDSLNKVGITPENREFHPHLTLGRVLRFQRQSCRLPSEILNFSSNQIFSVSRLVIFKSELGREGARHTSLRTFSFLPKETSKPSRDGSTSFRRHPPGACNPGRVLLRRPGASPGLPPL